MTNLSGANLNNGAAVGPQGEGMDSQSSFPTYPAYRCSGVEWLGEMPKHWEVTKLSYVTSRIGSGKTPSGGAATYASSGVPFIRSQNVHDQGLRLDDIVYIDEETDREMAWSRVRPLDVLINITGASIGRSCQVPAEFGRANVNQHVCVIRLDKVVEASDWVAWFMKSPSSKEQVKVSQTGAAREGLNFEQLAGFYLCMPPLNERKVITAFLDHETARIDALIEEQQRLIELLKEKRQAVISHAVTKGLDPTVPMKDSGVEWLGEVPAHWVCSELKRFASVQGGYAFPSDLFGDAGIAVIRIGDIQSDGTVSLVGCKRIEGDGSEYSRFQVVRGDLLMAMTGATIGKAGWYDDDEPAYLNQRVGAFRSGASLVMDFLYYITQSSGYQEHIKLTAYGGAQPNISDTGMLSYFSVVPPVEEQMEICRYLNDVLKHLSSIIAETERSLFYLQERRSALISAAVTGKIDVRGWQPPASTQAPELAVAEAN